MNLDEKFPLKFFLNLGTRQDRRFAVEDELARHRITAVRRPAVNARFVNHTRGFASPAKYACSLTKRLAIRSAAIRGSRSVLILEDDIKFHPEFSARIARLQLPDDWGIFFFGCLHELPPEPVCPGLVRVNLAVDNHAVAIRAPHFRAAIRAMTGGAKRCPDGTHQSSDVRFAKLQKSIPTYAAFPNLIWQRHSYSDNQKFAYSNYAPDGRQVYCKEAVAHLQS